MQLSIAFAICSSDGELSWHNSNARFSPTVCLLIEFYPSAHPCDVPDQTLNHFQRFDKLKTQLLAILAILHCTSGQGGSAW